MANAQADLVDVGAGDATLEIQTSGGAAVLATFQLAATAFGAAATGTCTAAGLPISATASGTGTAAQYQVMDGDGNVRWSGNVTATGGGGEATIDNTSVASGQSVTLTALSITMPAGQLAP
jgi:hypothetical protein